MRNKAIALTLGAAALVGAAALMQPVTANAAKPAQPKVTLAGLTWESSLQDALTKARLENKPVLHLQMFGKLDDAFCWTNARTLRAVLLSDDQFVAFAKDNLVVSWENVREPVNIQVDGERRTLGGNTVMYVVSPDGTVADAFPGVYRSEDVLPSLQAAVKVAMESHEVRRKYHRQRTSNAIQARINVSKAFVEGPVLDAIGAGDLFESSTVAGVIDLSHIASNREQTLKRLGIRSDLSEDEALRQAIAMDSRANMLSLRPKVHEFLLDEPKLPDEIRRTMFKDFLGVDIDDPNLGIR